MYLQPEPSLISANITQDESKHELVLKYENLIEDIRTEYARLEEDDEQQRFGAVRLYG